VPSAAPRALATSSGWAEGWPKTQRLRGDVGFCTGSAYDVQ